MKILCFQKLFPDDEKYYFSSTGNNVTCGQSFICVKCSLKYCSLRRTVFLKAALIIHKLRDVRSFGTILTALNKKAVLLTDNNNNETVEILLNVWNPDSGWILLVDKERYKKGRQTISEIVHFAQAFYKIKTILKPRGELKT